MNRRCLLFIGLLLSFLTSISSTACNVSKQKLADDWIVVQILRVDDGTNIQMAFNGMSFDKNGVCKVPAIDPYHITACECYWKFYAQNDTNYVTISRKQLSKNTLFFAGKYKVRFYYGDTLTLISNRLELICVKQFMHL
jgi:hypothetical protein